MTQQMISVQQPPAGDVKDVPTLMKAAVMTAPGQVEVDYFPLPVPGPGEIRVRLQGCGVCASNLPLWEGRDWFDYPQEPGAPGHEGWGVVDAVGPGVASPAPGQRVALLSYHAFATHDIAPAADVVALPQELDELPFPAEPLGCALNAFARTEIQAGQTVAIVGIGFFGALLAQLASGAGARVIAISRRPFALEIARRCGAAEALQLEEGHSVVEAVEELTDGALSPRVIEATGAQAGLDLATKLTAVRGRLIIAGYHQGARTVNMQQWNWRGLDVINAHERDPQKYRDGMADAACAVQAGRIDLAPLITHRFPLEGLPQAFALMRERPQGFLKAIVHFPESDTPE